MGRSAGIILAVLLLLASAIFSSAKAQTEQSPSQLTELQASADQGDAKAQTILGVMHALGTSIAPTNEDAAHWLARAKTQNDGAAQFACGAAFDYGMWGFPQDHDEAIRWYQVAADNGVSEAQYTLGMKYEEGDGVEQNYPRALMLYTASARHDNADADEALGDLFLLARGVDRDDRKAIEWYLKAAAQGKAGAESSLGFIYEFSETIPVDLPEAAKWYRLAADQNDAEAQYSLAMLYRDGRGVPQDNDQAYKWFSKAVTNADTTYQDDSIDELYSLAANFPAGVKLEPPLPPEPFRLTLVRWFPWFGIVRAFWAAVPALMRLGGLLCQIVLGWLAIGAAVLFTLWVVGRFVWGFALLLREKFLLLRNTLLSKKRIPPLNTGREWAIMKSNTLRIFIIAVPTIIIGGAIYLYLFPQTYDQCVALRVPLTTNIVATNSAINACRARFATTSDCKEQLLDQIELKMISSSAQKYADGDIFITLYNGNTNLEIKSGKFAVTEAASGTTRTYAFDEDIEPLSTRIAEVRTFPDNSNSPNWTWQLVEASACVK